MPRTFKIAVIPGDGIGKEVIPEGLRVLQAAAARFDLSLQFTHVEWASCDYYTQTGKWPAESATGTMPPELKTFLPKSFNFKPKDYQLDWDNWILPTGLPKYPKTSVFLGVSVSTTDKRLGLSVVALLKKAGAGFSQGSSYTLPIVGTNETL